MSMFCEGFNPQSRIFMSYENFESLTNEELQYALRIVHRELEKKLGISITDGEFIQLFSSIKKEHFLHPAGSWSGVTMRNVYNGPFISRAKLSNDEKRLEEIKLRGCWYIAPEASICHRFFRESFTTNFEKKD